MIINYFYTQKPCWVYKKTQQKERRIYSSNIRTLYKLCIYLRFKKNFSF